MKILVINGDCIQVNSSANLCHLAYIRGLLDAGHEVTLLSANGRDYEADPAMEIPEQVKCYSYYGVSIYEKLSLRKRAAAQSKQAAVSADQTVGRRAGGLGGLIAKVKGCVLWLYGVHGVYATFVRRAKKFRSEEEYDYVLSLSTPVTSHLLTYKLLRSGHIHAKHWVQIWEDPWYTDAYGFNHKGRIKREEERLLSFAEKVCYVSPLTLANQQRIFSKYADKMFWQPLPYYYRDGTSEQTRHSRNIYGYFGEYHPAARDLEPFYQAAKETSIPVRICGNPCNLFAPTKEIQIYPRLSLEKLKPLEDEANVLIFLCNRKGGQIPGKIYQYSATNKTILFVLDGTEEERTVLRNYFKRFHRYVFCENNKADIVRAIRAIESGNLGDVQVQPLEDFAPSKTVSTILELAK